MVEIELSNSRFESGYWNGLRQPVFIFDIRFTKFSIQRIALEQYDRIVEALLPNREAHVHPPAVDQHPLLSRIASTSLDILSAAGMPVMSGANALPIRRQDGIHWMLGLPAVSAEFLAPQWAFNWSVRILRFLERANETDIDSLRQDLQQLLKVSKRQAPSGVNTLRFLQAAFDEGIPWRHVANNVFQFGWGSKARWLDSSFTDETSRISATLARDKLACAKVLRDTGLPVPRHRRVASEAQALSAADEFSYPVVIKPADLDGGQGVFAGLRTPVAVQMAYAEASRLSKNILVEQYVEGNDYRLQVYKGEVLWAIHRRPAYVVGDGESTLAELIQKSNLDRKIPASDPVAEQARKAITIDAEVREWIASQGHALDSVPAQGSQIRLRGAANVNLGGTREGVLHKTHPDNLALAIRAAHVLRLDLAGIDLLISDISRSWREVGAVICEVNSQPQISRHLHRAILTRLVSRKGRIPVIGMVGMAPGYDSIRERLVAKMLSQNIRLGWAGSGKVSVGLDDMPLADANPQTGCWALLEDHAVDAVVWRVPSWPSSGKGMPFDRFDAIVLLNSETEAGKLGVSPRALPFETWSSRIWTLEPVNSPESGGQVIEELVERMALLIAENREGTSEERCNVC